MHTYPSHQHRPQVQQPQVFDMGRHVISWCHRPETDSSERLPDKRSKQWVLTHRDQVVERVLHKLSLCNSVATRLKMHCAVLGSFPVRLYCCLIACLNSILCNSPVCFKYRLQQFNRITLVGFFYQINRRTNVHY